MYACIRKKKPYVSREGNLIYLVQTARRKSLAATRDHKFTLFFLRARNSTLFRCLNWWSEDCKGRPKPDIFCHWKLNYVYKVKTKLSYSIFRDIWYNYLFSEISDIIRTIQIRVAMVTHESRNGWFPIFSFFFSVTRYVLPISVILNWFIKNIYRISELKSTIPLIKLPTRVFSFQFLEILYSQKIEILHNFTFLKKFPIVLSEKQGIPPHPPPVLWCLPKCKSSMRIFCQI